MKTMIIKDFENWLVESKQEESAAFINRVEDELTKRGLTEHKSYNLVSTATQIKNGTFAIIMDSVDLVKDALEERGVKDDDYKKSITSNVRIGFTIYSAGTARVTGTASSGCSFNPFTEVEKVIDWMIKQYKDSNLRAATKYLIPTNFIKKSKYKVLKVEDVKDFFTPAAYDEAKIFDKYGSLVSPDLAFLAFLSKVYNVKIDLYKNVDRKLFLEIKIPTGTVTLSLRDKWIIKKKVTDLEVKPELSWNGRNLKKGFYNTPSGPVDTIVGDWAEDMNALVKLDIIPERLLNVYKKMKKGDYDIDKLALNINIKVLLTAKKFGI